MPNTDPNREKRTVVDSETEFRGTMTSDCPVVVLGKVDGELEAPAIDVSSTGEVVGTIKAEKIRAEGTLAGEVDAGELYLSGTVRKDTVIRARSLEVKLVRDGGQLELTFGEGIEPVLEAEENTAEESPRQDDSDGESSEEASADIAEDDDPGDVVQAKEAPHTPPAAAPTSSPVDGSGPADDGESAQTDVDDLFADDGQAASPARPA